MESDPINRVGFQVSRERPPEWRTVATRGCGPLDVVCDYTQSGHGRLRAVRGIVSGRTRMPVGVNSVFECRTTFKPVGLSDLGPIAGAICM
jgi:hypothetical protein